MKERSSYEQRYEDIMKGVKGYHGSKVPLHCDVLVIL